MHIALFYHSLISDWNHGNAHFLRGIATELLNLGHDVRIYEPHQGWSLGNLIKNHGMKAQMGFAKHFPQLRSSFYSWRNIDLDAVLETADLVIVHEWNEAELIKKIGSHHARNPHYRLLFHDTHHRSVTARETLESLDLRGYDGVLAYGEIIRRTYLERGWCRRAWTWHEAADTNVFRPMARPNAGDVVWIGNWGDDERTDELREYLIEPCKDLRLRGNAYGVRFPLEAQEELSASGIKCNGWLANYRVPEVFAAHRVTIHVPRRPYVEKLPGIPTIRPFEAMACGIPLVCSWWDDAEHLFNPGRDYLVARNGREMRKHLNDVLNDPELARSLAAHGRETILARHTCAHRARELMEICASLGLRSTLIPPGEFAPATAELGAFSR